MLLMLKYGDVFLLSTPTLIYAAVLLEDAVVIEEIPSSFSGLAPRPY